MKQIIYTPKAPKPVGPYCQAILANNILYVSGQIALDPKTGIMCEGGVKAQTNQVLVYIQNILNAAGMDMLNVVKASIFLTDMNDFGDMNEVYAEFFTGNPPARECIQVARLPKNAVIEISVIAVKP
ncbi:MAG: RidA family protein [Bacteroidota bacterium]